MEMFVGGNDVFQEYGSEVTQLCLTLCHPMDSSLPGSSIHGIFQARILEWAAISFSKNMEGNPKWKTSDTNAQMVYDSKTSQLKLCTSWQRSTKAVEKSIRETKWMPGWWCQHLYSGITAINNFNIRISNHTGILPPILQLPMGKRNYSPYSWKAKQRQFGVLSSSQKWE